MNPTTFKVGDKNCVALIRKLTERECLRLMDVEDPDIDKMINSGVSRSDLYKLAGNSICVGNLYHIFRKIFAEPGNESRQLTIFDI